MKDPYIDENGVLKNKLGITNDEELKEAEKDIAFVKLIGVEELEKETVNANLLKDIHKYLFNDIYDWAGEYRTVPIYKEEVVLPGLSLEYAQPKDIEKRLEQEFENLNSIEWSNKKIDELSLQLTKSLARIWRVHPFRDGNTRTILSFSYMFAKEHNFPFDIEIFAKKLNRSYDNGKLNDTSIRDRFVLACLDDKDYPEVKYLASTFYTAMGQYNSVEQTKNTK